jgi:L-idonate 5-dehydrogenase
VAELKEKRVLVNGAGPIGALCVAVARYHGAEEIVVADLFTKTLDVAREMGADKVINLATAVDGFAEYTEGKGYFDVIFECSAAQGAIDNVFKVIRPQGTIVQVGVSGEVSLPTTLLVGKEIKWVGSHRFHHEYVEAVSLISSRKIDVRPMITDVFSVTDAVSAIHAAGDRSRSVKVQLSFEE